MNTLRTAPERGLGMGREKGEEKTQGTSRNWSQGSASPERGATIQGHPFSISALFGLVSRMIECDWEGLHILSYQEWIPRIQDTSEDAISLRAL